jgi:hypothetical protein
MISESKIVTAEDILNRAVFGDDVGMSTAWRRNSGNMRNNLRLLRKLWLTLKPNKAKLPQKMGSL